MSTTAQNNNCAILYKKKKMLLFTVINFSAMNFFNHLNLKLIGVNVMIQLFVYSVKYIA